jgi:hypothetical protein
MNVTGPGFHDMVQEVLERSFSDTDLVPEDVLTIEGQARIIDFPRSLHCHCKRCTSQYVELTVLGWNLTLHTTKGEYHGWVPGPKDTWEHK